MLDYFTACRVQAFVGKRRWGISDLRKKSDEVSIEN
jgi:hypothetical protein